MRNNTASPVFIGRPWYREFWVWVMIALPMSAVIAGISTVIIANAGSDALVVDDFQKVGLVARRETAREREALRLGLGANVAIDRTNGQVTVRLTGDAAPARLTLGAFHPTRRDMDRTTTLTRDDTGLYRGNIGSGLAGHWYIQLGDGDMSWRITAKLADDVSLFVMGSAVTHE